MGAGGGRRPWCGCAVLRAHQGCPLGRVTGVFTSSSGSRVLPTSLVFLCELPVTGQKGRLALKSLEAMV